MRLYRDRAVVLRRDGGGRGVGDVAFGVVVGGPLPEVFGLRQALQLVPAALRARGLHGGQHGVVVPAVDPQRGAAGGQRHHALRRPLCAGLGIGAASPGCAASR